MRVCLLLTVRFVRMLTFLPVEQIDEMDTWEGAQLNEAKTILARELTSLVHGEEEMKKAESSAKALFGGGAEDADVPACTLRAEDLTNGVIDILSILVASGLNPSKSEARRAVQQGGVTVNGEKVTDISQSYTADALKEGLLVRRGKKNFKKVTL